MHSNSTLWSETLQLFPLPVMMNSNYILVDNFIKEQLTRTNFCPKQAFWVWRGDKK